MRDSSAHGASHWRSFCVNVLFFIEAPCTHHVLGRSWRHVRGSASFCAFRMSAKVIDLLPTSAAKPCGAWSCHAHAIHANVHASVMVGWGTKEKASSSKPPSPQSGCLREPKFSIRRDLVQQLERGQMATNDVTVVVVCMTQANTRQCCSCVSLGDRVAEMYRSQSGRWWRTESGFSKKKKKQR